MDIELSKKCKAKAIAEFAKGGNGPAQPLKLPKEYYRRGYKILATVSTPDNVIEFFFMDTREDVQRYKELEDSRQLGDLDERTEIYKTEDGFLARQFVKGNGTPWTAEDTDKNKLAEIVSGWQVKLNRPEHEIECLLNVITWEDLPTWEGGQS